MENNKDNTTEGLLHFLTMCSMIRRIFTADAYKNSPPIVKKHLVKQVVSNGISRGADRDFMQSILPILTAYNEDILGESDVIYACESAFDVFDAREIMYEQEKELNEKAHVTHALASILASGGIHVDLTDKPTEQQ